MTCSVLYFCITYDECFRTLCANSLTTAHRDAFVHIFTAVLYYKTGISYCLNEYEFITTCSYLCHITSSYAWILSTIVQTWACKDFAAYASQHTSITQTAAQTHLHFWITRTCWLTYLHSLYAQEKLNLICHLNPKYIDISTTQEERTIKFLV